MLHLQQANHYDVEANQQGYFTFLHKWIFLVDSKQRLHILSSKLGNIINVAAIVQDQTRKVRTAV